jgi:hypothetical protein
MMKIDGTSLIPDPPSLMIPPTDDHLDENDHCFKMFLDSEKMVPLLNCFTQQPDDTIIYKTGGGLTTYEGVLHWVGEEYDKLDGQIEYLSQDFFFDQWQGEFHYSDYQNVCNVNDSSGVAADLEVTNNCPNGVSSPCLIEHFKEANFSAENDFDSLIDTQICFRASNTWICLSKIDENTVLFTDNDQEIIQRCGIFTRIIK